MVVEVMVVWLVAICVGSGMMVVSSSLVAIVMVAVVVVEVVACIYGCLVWLVLSAVR